MIRRILLMVLAVVVVTALWMGYEVYTVYTDVSRTYRVAPRIAIEPRVTPVTNFFGNHRINVLLLGSDNDQKFQQQYPLSQSMIVVTIDPVHDDVSMLSIPRDFWVPIPGYGMGKIDTAAEHGGVSLARATVENLLHINIDYYAWIGLNGFSHVVDDFGGVTVNITHPILDDFYPNDLGTADPYAYTRVFIPPGWHHLSGRQALDYVRSRHGDAVGDFGRSARQQQVMLRLQKQAGGWNLLLKIPRLSHDLSSMVRTDMDLRQLLDMARLSRHILPSHIKRVVLSAPTYCQYSTSADGQSILVPYWRAILPVTRAMFAPIQPTAPSASAHVAVPAHLDSPSPTTVPQRSSPPLPIPSATPVFRLPARLPGTLIYASGGTFYRLDRTGHVTSIMPSWMNAAAMPAVSRDGRTVAFVRWSREASDIDIYSLRSHNPLTQVTKSISPDPTFISNSLWAAWPTWSPDGKTILFSGDGYKLQLPANESRQQDLAIYAMDPNGSNLRQLTTPDPGAGGDTDPQFRGKTSEYLYDHWSYNHQNGLAVGQPYSQLMIRDVTNSARVWTLTPPSGQIVQPALDRTGNNIAYIQNGPGTSTLVSARIVNSANGPHLYGRKVIASGQIAQPAFTPDGRRISYLRAEGSGFALFLAPASGGAAVQINAPGSAVDAESRPIWSP
ncbi:MAG TPA: LCP family protein [Chloroflexota bacterium]